MNVYRRSRGLYNRDYCLLWARSKDEIIEAMDPDCWVVYEEEDYFNDGRVPWCRNKKRFAEQEAVLDEWDVLKQSS